MARRPTKNAPVSFTGDERICVLHGKEQFLISQYTLQLRDAIQKRIGDREVERVDYDGQNCELADVFDELRSMGLMQQYKLVVVDHADQFVTRNRDALERYAEHPTDLGTLLLRSEKWNKGKLDKKIEKVGQLIKCDAVDAGTATQWATRRTEARYERKLAPDAARALVERLGTDLTRLDSELSKLALAGDARQPISVADVERLVGRSSEQAAYEIQSALLTGRASDALAKLHELVDLAGQPDVLVLYFVADLVRKLNQAVAMRQAGVPDNVILKELRIWGDRSRPFLAAAHRLGPERTAQLLAMIVEMDRRAKSGYGDFVRNLERFCVLLASQLR